MKYNVSQLLFDHRQKRGNPKPRSPQSSVKGKKICKNQNLQKISFKKLPESYKQVKTEDNFLDLGTPSLLSYYQDKKSIIIDIKHKTLYISIKLSNNYICFLVIL